MIKYFIKIYNDTLRNLKDVSFAFRLHGITFILTFILFFLSGILPLFTVLKTKVMLLSEMNDRYSIMQDNLVKLEQAEIALNNSQEHIGYLDRYMPEETSIQDYILDFIGDLGESNFVARGFSQDPNNDNTGQVTLAVTLEGNDYPTEIIKRIETLKRVTQVQTVTFYVDPRDEILINLVLVIYNYII